MLFNRRFQRYTQSKARQAGRRQPAEAYRILSGRDQEGVAILTIVIVMFMLAIIGAAMYSLTTTSTYNQIVSQGSMKAHYVAESGFRIVTAEYAAASGTNAKNTTLENLHGNTFALSGNEGQFTLQLFPYWFYSASTQSISPGGTITLNLPGGVPRQDPEDSATEVTLPSSGALKLKGKTRPIWYSASSSSGSSVTFTIANPAPAPWDQPGYSLDPGDELFLVYDNSGAADQTVPVDGSGDLRLPKSDDVAAIYPAENGTFRWDRYPFRYERKIDDPVDPASYFLLTNIDDRDPSDPYPGPIELGSTAGELDALLHLGKNLAVLSTSSYSQGPMTSSKALTEYTSVEQGFTDGKETISFEDDIDDFDQPAMNTPPGGGTPILVDKTNRRVILGGGSTATQGFGALWYEGDSDLANCINGECEFGKGFSAYFEFVMDNDAGNGDSLDFGDGFTFAVTNGQSNDFTDTGGSDDTSGPTGELLGYAGPGLSGNGLQPPKFAVEIDTFPDPGAGPICAPNSRRDLDDAADPASGSSNHASLVFWGAELPGSLDNANGFMRIGSATPGNGQPEDWSSPAGTISFWFKRTAIDTVNQGDRPWGQHDAMEMRFVDPSGDLVLDWGINDALVVPASELAAVGQWYFIAVTWDENALPAPVLQCYVGDPDNAPAPFTAAAWPGGVDAVGISGYQNTFMAARGLIGSGSPDLSLGPVQGRGADLRYYDAYLDSSQIGAVYNDTFSSTTNLRARFRLDSDFAGAGSANLTAAYDDNSGTGIFAWSADVPADQACRVGNADTFDDNRHGAGILQAATPPPADVANSLNTDTAGGDDGYYTDTAAGAAWLEDGALHNFRIEVLRPESDDPPGSGAYKYQIKTWIDCTACNDVTEHFTAEAPLITKTIGNGNPVVLAQAVHDALDLMLFGFTEATGSVSQTITLSDFEIYFLKRYPAGYPAAW